jgi:hypothetical protein
LKRVLLKTKDVLDFNVSTQPCLVLSKVFKTQSFAKMNPCIRVKTALRKKKRFCFKMKAPSKVFCSKTLV